jgi:hypothetical protein
MDNRLNHPRRHLTLNQDLNSANAKPNLLAALNESGITITLQTEAAANKSGFYNHSRDHGFRAEQKPHKAPQAATTHAGNNSSTPRKKTQQLPSIITTAKQKS